MSVLVVGSVALDDIETPLETRRQVVGGSATYAASAAAIFAPVRLVGVVGDDFPEDAVKRLEARGVDLAGLERVPGKTFHWSGRYLDDFHGRETIDTQLNVFERFSPEVPEAFRASSLVFLGNIHPDLQLRVLDQIESPTLVACDTMNFWIDGARDQLLEVLRRVDLAIVNDEEARDLSGRRNLAAAGRAICELGPKGVIVKLGAHGALYVAGDEIFLAPGYPEPALRDPTGAGDSFAGALMGALARSQDLSSAGVRRAMVLGCVVASFAIECFGPVGLDGFGGAEIRERYAALRRLTSFDDDLDGLL